MPTLPAKSSILDLINQIGTYNFSPLRRGGFTPLKNQKTGIHSTSTLLRRQSFLGDERRSCNFLTGFTLIEMIVAFAIFSVIMVVSVGSLLSLLQANQKAQTLKTVVNNLNFAFENMSRNLRTGSAYHCGAAQGNLDEPNDCSRSGATSIIFSARDGTRIAYRLTGATIERSLDGGATYVPITAPEIRVDRLYFYVDGSSLTDNLQPRVLILSSGEMSKGAKIVSSFNIQTLVSQRLLDMN